MASNVTDATEGLTVEEIENFRRYRSGPVNRNAICDAARSYVVEQQKRKRVEEGVHVMDAAPSAEQLGYKPCVVEMEDSGISEFVLFDCATIHGGNPDEDGYQEIYDRATRRIIGFSWPTKCPPERGK